MRVLKISADQVSEDSAVNISHLQLLTSAIQQPERRFEVWLHAKKASKVCKLNNFRWEGGSEAQ